VRQAEHVIRSLAAYHRYQLIVGDESFCPASLVHQDVARMIRLPFPAFQKAQPCRVQRKQAHRFAAALPLNLNRQVSKNKKVFDSHLFDRQVRLLQGIRLEKNVFDFQIGRAHV